MAESDDTIRQLLGGLNSMSMHMGLLPMQGAQAMAGAGSQFQALPPPPQIMHPSNAALQAMQQQQMAMQQTLMAAQQTRYIPPPSAPTPSMGAMSAFGSFNPFAPSGIQGGGGGQSGGQAGQVPSVFNPFFTPSLPRAHFSVPAMRHAQVAQAHQSQWMSGMAGAGDMLGGMAGGAIGGAIGSMFGPLGTMAGSFLGDKLGSAVTGMIFNPVVKDFARGRQIQSMTSPFMVSGPNLNTLTGQGMDQYAARQTATGLRNLKRDYDFERTGFNSNDTMKIMGLSSEQGLLTGAQTPDQLVKKVKDISKTVKVLMRITGDPDVRDAIQSLGQMRDIGFQGLANQAGAVASRQSFARMAGMSPAAMLQTGMGGADMASQFGLVGATGFSAGMAGAAMGNMAASSGALSDLQLARAGGRQGLGQINTMGSLAAMNDERYLLASMRRGEGGKLSVDMGAYRQSQTMTLDEVSRKSAEVLRNMGAEGIFQWNTQKQELKDQIAQKLSPFEGGLNMYRQAMAYKNRVPGMTLGTALQASTGLDANQARSLEVQGQSTEYWNSMIQQQKIMGQDAAAQRIASSEQYRTPGVITRLGRGIRGTIAGIGEGISSPFRAFSEHMARVNEEEDAASRGQNISRYTDLDIVRNSGERRLLQESLKRGGLNAMVSGGGIGSLSDDDGDYSARDAALGAVAGSIVPGIGTLAGAVIGGSGRMRNRFTSALGLTAQSSSNRLASIANRGKNNWFFGLHPFASFGGTNVENFSDLQNYQGAAAGIENAQTLGVDKAVALSKGISSTTRGKYINGDAILDGTTRNMIGILKDIGAGTIGGSDAAREDHIKRSYLWSAKINGGMTEGEAVASWNTHKEGIVASVAKDVYASGDQKLIEPWEKARTLTTEGGAIDLMGSTEKASKALDESLDKLGLGNVDEKTLADVKSIVSNNDKDVVAVATALSAMESGNDTEKEGAERVLSNYRTQGPEKYRALREKAVKLRSSFSGKSKDALELTLRGAKSSADVEGKIEGLQGNLGDRMKLASVTEFRKILGEIKPGAENASSIGAALDMIGSPELEKMSKGDRELYTKAKAGDQAAINKLVERSAPGGKITRHGMATTEESRRMVGELEEMRDQLASGQASGPDAAATVTSSASIVFANAVDKFAHAVGMDKDNKELNAGDPTLAAFRHDTGG